MPTRWIVSIVLSLLASACGGTGLSPPSPTAPTVNATPTAPRTMPFQVDGVATDDEGRPLAEAKVTMHPWVFGGGGNLVTDATDALGVYRIAFEAMRDAVGGVGSVLAEKAGYESDERYIKPAGSTASQNVRLYRIKRIVAGESTQVTVAADDPSCGINFEWTCRTVRVTSPSSGILTIEAFTNASPGTTALELPRPPYHCCSSSASVAILAGAEVVANLLVVWTAKESQLFTVRTSLALR